jgi:hypothetical protein
MSWPARSIARIAATGYKEMKILRLPLVLFWLALLPAAYAQQNGIIEGRLINRTDPSIVARGVEVEVIELGSGMSIIRTAVTDSSGRFRIEGLPENRQLMIRADYRGAYYNSQLNFNAAGRATVEIDIFEPTTSMKDIQVEGVQMAFQMVGDRLKSLETVTVNNKTKPPKTFMNPEGNFRISKAPGILELPQISVTAPGSTLPLVQSALESADGQSYYSLYPLRPGITTFEVQQLLPYTNRSYTYIQKFYQDVGRIDIGVIPRDMALSGKGLSKIQTDSDRNFSVYTSTPVKAGSEVMWTFSGGTPVPDTQSSEIAADSTVAAMPNSVGRDSLFIGPLLLMGFILVLWYAFNRSQGVPKVADIHARQLKERREQLLNNIADLDHRYETHSVGRPEFLRQREEGKRQLRRISLILKRR